MTDFKSLFEESSKSRGVFRAQASIYHGAFMWINLTAHYFRNKISTIIIRVPKRAFVFLQRNTEFHSCTQRAIRFFYSEMQNFTVVPKRPFVFHNKIENFESYTQTAICISHKKSTKPIYHQLSFVS